LNQFNILLPIEIIARELDYKLFLAVSLANKNTNVIIAQHDYFDKHCSRFAGGIYIGKNCFIGPFLEDDLDHSKNLTYLNELKKSDISVFYLDEEGAVWRGDEIAWKAYIDSRVKPEVFSENDYIFTWGDYQKKHLEGKKLSFSKSNIIASGHPKYDLYKPKYRQFFKKEIDGINEKYKSFILINTITQRANGLMGLKGSFADKGEGWDCYSVNDAQKRMKYIGVWAQENMVLTNFVKLIHRLSMVFSEKTFVLRPHPGEDPEFYQTVFSGIKNIHVEKHGSVSPWIMAADLVIQDGCTTAIESFLAGMPIINYRSINNDLFESVLPNKFGVQCKTEDEVIQAINDIYKNPSSFVKMNSLTPLTASLMKNLQAEVYDDFINLCRKLIDEKLNKNSNGENISIQKMRFAEMVYSLVLLCKARVRPFFKLRAIQYSAGKVFFPGFNQTMVEEKVRSIERILGKEVSLEYLSDRLLVITDGKSKVQ
jgi:surface carbohydrate biosynthesis protein